WRRLVEHADARPGAARRLDAVETGACLAATWTDRPHLTGRQRVSFDGFVAVEFRRRHELLDAFRTEDVAEVRVAELTLEAALLLLLYTTTRLEGGTNDPFEVVV